MRRRVVIKPTSASNAGALVLIFLLAAAALTIAIINRVEYAPTVSPTASPGLALDTNNMLFGADNGCPA